MGGEGESRGGLQQKSKIWKEGMVEGKGRQGGEEEFKMRKERET